MNPERTLRSLRRLWQRPSREQRLAVEALGYLVGFKAILVFVPFKHWRRLLHSPKAAQAPSEARETVRSVTWSVARIGALAPNRLTCLPRALAARAMLERRGVPCRMRIGVRRDAKGQFMAHAWLEYDGQIILGNLPELSSFSELVPTDAAPPAPASREP